MTTALKTNPDIRVIIPAFNEAESIAAVINEIPKSVSQIIVVNNNSTDNTIINAEKAGATVLTENRKRIWLCLFERDKFYYQTIQTTRYYRIYRWRLFRLP